MDPFDALYQDLADLGDIFGVRAKADVLVAGYRDQVAAARATAPAGQTPAWVFLFDSATPEPFTSGRPRRLLRSSVKPAAAISSTT
jgi:iron complex transport system substrate-binding protein